MRNSKLLWLALCTVLTSIGGLSARADDTEIFFSNTSTAVKPNVLLVLDTSGSMSVEATSSQLPYESAKTYSVSGCDTTAVYYATNGTMPGCSSTQKIPKTNFKCVPATAAFSSSGKYTGYGVRWVKRVKNSNSATIFFWSANFNPSQSSYTFTLSNDVTCQNDTDSQYPVAGTASSTLSLWGGTVTDNYFTPTNSPTLTSYTFYDGNYVAWANDPSQSTSYSRMDIVKTAAKSLIDSLSGVNVGVMRYDSGGDGGMVIAPVQDVTTGAGTLKTSIDNLHTGGNTPLSETLHEAYLYYTGGDVNYGKSSTACSQDMLTCDSSHTQTSLSVAGSRIGSSSSSNTYKSPITSACQSNYVVFLTDGLPNGDSSSNSAIEGLDSSSTGCYKDSSSMWTALGYSSVPSVTYYDGTTGLCLKEMSKVLYGKDLSSSLAGTQNVTTYFIGFGNNVGAGAPQKYLEDAAKAGGGKAEIAADATELANAFDKTFGQILNTSANFSAPSVAVNSFNRLQVLEDMYVAMFEPSKTAHWPGNLKKFKFRNGMIVGKDTTVSAVNPATGFLTTAAEDFWQQTGDTNTDITTKGGAANMIPAPTVSSGSRNLYTYIGTNHPSSLQPLANHLVTTTNAAITATLLNIGGASDPARDVLINWARGDEDGNLNTTGDIRHEMGGPLHSQPSVVIYGNSGTTTQDKLNDAVVYVATNDGYLHAIDVVTGTELWAYIPQELLSDLKILYADTASPTKHYSLDGDVQVLKYDINNDGRINPADNDRIFLYVGQGRGGDHYYALDITDKNNPKFMWNLGSGDLYGIVNKSWSTPQLGRIKVGDGSAQNTQKLVLIFGGGYDDSEDSQSYFTSDAYGNGIFIVDAIKGTVLWHQTQAASGAFAKMTHAIPSDITVLDTNNDGWTDRMYVGDMAGQVWRFDITTGNPASTLVAGGVIASLGGKEAPTTAADNRSFYNAPDISYFEVKGGSNFYNIAIGSGDRGLPRSNTTTADRFYSIRDYNLGPLSQAAYDAKTPMKDSQLATIDGSSSVTINDGDPGWKFPLSTAEKSLSPSITVDGTVMFSTYHPSNSTDACSVTSGAARVYAINVRTGIKRFNDLFETFATTGIPPSINIFSEGSLIRTDGSTDNGDDDDDDDDDCTDSLVKLKNCVKVKRKVKTFWREAGAQ